MDRGMVLFVGALLTFSSSWLGLVLYPFWQLNGEKPFPDPDRIADQAMVASGSVKGDVVYPQRPTGRARAGARVYQANGCLYCHTQQVRSERFGNWWEGGVVRTGADIKRGWGTRRTVSRDYLYDNPVLLGTMRTGPDLATVGPRYAAKWQHAHLFNPRALNPWSIMPSFAFLYTRERISGQRSDKAVELNREWTVDPGRRWRPTDQEWEVILATQGDAIARAARSRGEAAPDLTTADGRRRLLDFWLATPEENYQVVPTEEAEALVEYLLRLNKTEVPLPEAKE